MIIHGKPAVVGGISGKPIEVATELEMDLKLSSSNFGKVFLYIGLDGKYKNGCLYICDIARVAVNLDAFMIPEVATELNITDELEA